MKYIFLCLLLTIVACASQPALTMNDRDQFIVAIENGNKIVIAIESYKNDIGHYPESLDILIGEYLNVIPSAGLYGNYFYATGMAKDKNGESKDRYVLSFYPHSGFIFNDAAWTYFEYDSWQEYEHPKVDIHFIIDGWAYITSHKHAVGEAGRIE